MRREQHQDDQRAEQAELLPDHREDEVGVRLGQGTPLLPAAAEAHAPPAAGAQRVLALGELPAGPVERSALGVAARR